MHSFVAMSNHSLRMWIQVLCLTVVVGASIQYVDGLSTSTSDRDGRKLFGGYRITPKFCRASKTLPRSDPRSHGPTICMFNHECTQRQGEVVGACMDGFLFGACCQLQGSVDAPLGVDESEIVLESNAQSAAAQSYESYGHNQQQQQQHHHHHQQPSIYQNNNTPTGSSNDNDAIGYNEIKIEDNFIAHRPTISQHNSVIINNVYGGDDGGLDEDSSNTGSLNDDNYLSSAVSNEPELFVVDHDSVSVSSPSPEYGVSSSSSAPSSYFPSSTTLSRPTSASGMYLPPSSTGSAVHQQPNHELPTRIPTGPYEVSSAEATASDDGFTPDHFSFASDAAIYSQSTDFTHSGITHPGVDAVIIGDENTAYGGSSIGMPSSTERLSTSTSTERDVYTSSTEHKVTYAKPAFRPKPTKKPQNSDQYVLVQTINHNGPIKADVPAKPQATMSENDIESIESIILMLNDSKTGPQYNTGSSTEAAYDYSTPGSTNSPSFSIYGTQGTAQPSTANIDYEKYGTNSYYITTKVPASDLPSTSYVFSPQSTRKPINVQSTIASSFGAVVPEVSIDHLLQHALPSSSLSPPLVSDNLAITKRPVILTAASFATTNTGTPASTNYVYISTPTRRPTTQEDYISSTTQNPNTNINKKTKRPNTKVSTPQPPSTSFVTGPTTPRPTKRPVTTKIPSTSFVYTSVATRRPATRPTNKINNRKNATTVSPTIVFRPTYGNYPSSTDQDNLVYEHAIQSKPLNQQLYDASTENPSPTVHITPKPTVNLVTSSTWTQQPSLINRYTTPIIKSPSTSYIFSPVSTMRPGNPDASAIPIFSSGYGSSITYSSSPANKNPDTSDFDDPGYYGISSTLRPHINTPQPVTAASAGYTVHDATAAPPLFPGFYGSTPSFGPEVIEYSTLKDEYYTSPNDFNNFPPVRNPNLNISSGAVAGGFIDEYEISTPNFVEDEALNDKMGLLVSKIVESLQGNFEQLADVVYDDTVVQGDPIVTSARPGTTVKRPSSGTTRKPAQKTTTKKPSINNAGRPTSSRPGAVTTKRPSGTRISTSTTKRPSTGASSQNPKRTTKKPATTLNTTKKPVTKLPTTRRPTTKPTKKVTQTTTAQQNDAVEDDEEEDEEEEEEIIDEETEQTTAFGEGRLQCGVRPQVKSGRIVGGKGATFGEFPWQVLVRESTWLGLFTKNKCGGVLISKMYVVTAAHCQPGFLASLVTVFGEFDISGELEAKRSVTKNVKRVVVHREYDAATFENDLALLELESAIHYDTHIVPICMPSDTADFTGRMATVTGWGRLKYGGGVPSVLQEVQVPVIENSVCQEMFHTAGHNKKILPSFLCAGYANGQKDSCEGDSGGPLVLQRADGRYELAGTVSHGIKCAAPYLPGVYMRTTYYKPWLQSVTGVH